MWKAIKSRLTMTRNHCLFVDKVNGKEVHLYIDCYGTKWMAQSKFGSRIKY